MNHIAYEDLYDYDIDQSLVEDAILHTHEPFVKDYLTLHILLQEHNPKSVFEIGTHVGEGTQIICNAVPDAKVYSLDLSSAQRELSLQHPYLKGMEVGEMCKLPYMQLLNDSMLFNYLGYPCEAYFIDGEHDYPHPRYETIQAIKCNAKLIIWHDADILEVWNAINDCFEWNNDYELFRVNDTRIAYAIRK